MTPEEAIKAIETMKDICRNLFPPKEQEALSLGIEALKKYKGDKEAGCIRSDYFLPGETKSPLKIRGARGVMKDKKEQS